jgi:thiol-disulfide isomerase/thioredoxin
MVDNSGVRPRATPRLPLGRLGRVVLVVLALHGMATAGEQKDRAVQMRDLDGRPLRPFTPSGKAAIVFFVATDCPISNAYAPEIQRVCREYGPRGVGCSLAYEDVDTGRSPAQLDEQVRRHLAEYGYRGVPAAIDRERVAARFARATITPQAVVVDPAGAIRYRGRIDNLYAAFGKTRQQVTSHDLRDALDAVLSGRKVPNPETEALGCFIVDPAQLRTHAHE